MIGMELRLLFTSLLFVYNMNNLIKNIIFILALGFYLVVSPFAFSLTTNKLNNDQMITYLENEEWRDIKGYEGLYQISNMGRVKSLERIIIRNNGSKLSIKEKIRKLSIGTTGYLHTSLTKKHAKLRLVKIHQLMSVAFLKYELNGNNEFVTDHINNIKTDNRICVKIYNNTYNNIAFYKIVQLSNLQVITIRRNSSKDRKGGTSIYTGVHFDRKCNKYASIIRVDGKKVSLGYFDSEIDATITYNKALKLINEGFNHKRIKNEFRKNLRNEGRRVFYAKNIGKWSAGIRVDSDVISLGYFEKKEDAELRYKEALIMLYNGFVKSDIISRFSKKKSSKYKGVSFEKSSGKWISRYSYNKKAKNIGRFKTEKIAYAVRLYELENIKFKNYDN